MATSKPRFFPSLDKPPFPQKTGRKEKTERNKGQEYGVWGLTHGKIHIMFPLLRTLPTNSNRIKSKTRDVRRDTQDEKAKKQAVKKKDQLSYPPYSGITPAVPSTPLRNLKSSY